jgi:hypothetical protein
MLQSNDEPEEVLMNAQLTQVIREIERTNLNSEKLEHLLAFVRFLAYEQNLDEEPERLPASLGMLPTHLDIDQDPILRLIGIFDDGTLSENIDDVVYSL